MDGLAIAAFLLAYSNLLNLWPPFNGLAYVPFNVTTAALLFLVALGPLHLETSDLGLSGPDLVEICLAAATGALLTLPLFIAIKSRRGLSFIADERVKGLWGGALVYQTVVRVPLGTALLEELAFRGALLAAWSDLGTTTAVIASSAAFGLWHISPTLNLVRANHPGASTARTVRTVAGAVLFTAAAGAGLAALRLWTDSLFVPMVMHAAVNSLATLAGTVAHKTVDRSGEAVPEAAATME